MALYKRFIIGLFTFIFSISVLTSAEPPRPDKEALVAMRDGTLLPVNFYFPNHTLGKYPCVLIRDPLGKENVLSFPQWMELTNAGYAVVSQSTRSACDPTGKTLPYLTEATDGYDTVEWLAKCEWCNGKVATIGMSATGITQFLMAPSGSQKLQCQYIEVAAPSLYDYAVWPGGSFRKEQVEGWLKTHKSAASVFDWLHTKSEYDAFWQKFDSLRNVENVSAPQMLVAGWYDIFLQGTLDSFVATQSRPSKVSHQHKLIIGPWNHTWQFSNQFGDFTQIREGKRPPHPITLTTWLDHYLKGVDNGISKIPQVQYYVMGPLDGTPSKGNSWRVAHKWPPEACYVNFYLTEDHSLQASITDKVIFTDLSFSPENPVPTVGGRNLFMPAGPKDLTSIESRSDVLSFTTNALEADLEVTGRIFGTFCVQNIAADRDLCCRISDVYPDGKSILISEGACHLRPSKDKEQTVVVDFWSTSMVFAKNHKIRLSISASNFPAQEMHLKANPDNSPVSFSLCTGGKKNCYIALPTIRHYDLPSITVCSNKEMVTQEKQ